MPNNSFSCIDFHQFESQTEDDNLLLFAAPAKKIAQWAGIPRKGWRMRMLFQRWITESRKRELVDFWDRASSPQGDQEYIVGPTAIVVALRNKKSLTDGKICLDPEVRIDSKLSVNGNLQNLATHVLPSVYERLDADQKLIVDDFSKSPEDALPDVEHDYVLEFALQLRQIESNVAWFRDQHKISDDEGRELIQALDAISRPAIVVDGQHRVWGASKSKKTVWLPVVAIPNASWSDQIYQFIVINEKAKPIETSLLTDIFGSSLTRQEQGTIRDDLARVGVEVESRIAAVIAGRDSESPFFNMVKLKVETPLPDGVKPYISDKIIRDLINGGGGSLGWRTDATFFDEYVAPTIPDKSSWEQWSSGAWREYWFEFWKTVGFFFNELQRKETQGPVEDSDLLWSRTDQSNLTKGVTLKILQSLFIEKTVSSLASLTETKSILIEALGDVEAEKKFEELLETKAIPEDLERFRENVCENFLRYLPLRIFTADWETSLDDQSGRQHLYDMMDAVFERTKKNKRWQFRSFPNVFIVKKDKSES